MSYTVYQAAAGFGDATSDSPVVTALAEVCRSTGGVWSDFDVKCYPSAARLAAKTACEATNGTYNLETGVCTPGIPTVIPTTPTTPKTGWFTKETLGPLTTSPLIKDPGITPSVPGTTKVAAVAPTPVGPVVTPVVPVPPVPGPPKKGFLTTTNLLIGAGLLGVLGIAVAVSSKKSAPAPLTARGRK